MRRVAFIPAAAAILAIAAYMVWVRIPATIHVLRVTSMAAQASAQDIARSPEMEIGYDIVISAADARTIAWREAYVFAMLSDCTNPATNYPANLLASAGFDDLRAGAKAGREVTLHATVPAHVAARLKLRCARIEGGSYLFGSVASPTVRLPL